MAATTKDPLAASAVAVRLRLGADTAEAAPVAAPGRWQQAARAAGLRS